MRPFRFRSASSSRLLVLALLLSACADKSSTPPATPASEAAAAPRRPAPGDPSCPRDGRWKPCALLDRVTHAGLVVKELGDTMKVPYLAVPGVRYRVGRATVLVAFFYSDSAAAARDLAKLDTARLTPPGDTLGAWPTVPVVIRSANLVAALLDASVTRAERLGLAITAGPPQPSSTDPTAPGAQPLPSKTIRP
jgi:hypothetical protein